MFSMVFPCIPSLLSIKLFDLNIEHFAMCIRWFVESGPKVSIIWGKAVRNSSASASSAYAETIHSIVPKTGLKKSSLWCPMKTKSLSDLQGPAGQLEQIHQKGLHSFASKTPLGTLNSYLGQFTQLMEGRPEQKIQKNSSSCVFVDSSTCVFCTRTLCSCKKASKSYGGGNSDGANVLRELSSA